VATIRGLVDTPQAALSRFFAAAIIVAVPLFVAPAAARSVKVHAALGRIGSMGAAGAVVDNHGGAPQRLSASLASREAPPPAGTPGPIAGRGYRVVFVDRFRRLRRKVWDNHEWWNTPPPRRSQYVRNGIFHLVSRRSQGYPSNISATTFSSQKVFKFGYFEARMRWTKGNGSWPGFWLMSNAWAKTGNCATPSAEIDVFEGFGSYPNVFTGTIHRNSADWLCPPTDEINANQWQPQGVDLTARFHTYAMRWTPARVTWYLDQRKVMSWPVWETTNRRMFLLLSMYVGGASSPDSSTPAELHTMVDWVRVWQKR
jgi:Glycosyl hydrolases family 16